MKKFYLHHDGCLAVLCFVEDDVLERRVRIDPGGVALTLAELESLT